MKNLILIIVAVITCSVSSCSWSGGDSLTKTSTYENFSGKLVSKKPTDYDKKFGNEILVADDRGNTRKYVKVFVPEKTYRRLPDPDDSTTVSIEYIEDVEYGANRGLSLWDFQFNLCTGFTVEHPHK